MSMIVKYELEYTSMFRKRAGFLEINIDGNHIEGKLIIEKNTYEVLGSTDGINFTIDYGRNYWIGKFIDDNLEAEMFTGYGNHKIIGAKIIA